MECSARTGVEGIVNMSERYTNKSGLDTTYVRGVRLNDTVFLWNINNLIDRVL